MFFLLKLSVLTCLFYLGFTVLMEAAIFLAARVSGGFFYFLQAVPFGIVFGVAWLASFSLAWHITFSRFVAKFPQWRNASSVFLNH
jgi:hypothetical protein